MALGNNEYSLIGSSNINCVNQLRMDRRTFVILCELLRTDDKLMKDGLVTIEEQVVTTAWMPDKRMVRVS
ncbi:hypothetical protein Dsin_016834 [Dipteronia sinensis]|uniref:DUF8040 domain-containing protein n=1 Tax=Dipteronia sinensis TaxID=43782 RepID=A0AAE0AET8_9ROSI|nr:hypothetical protein Dsin_016834 [Dipteronia sinensis]